MSPITKRQKQVFDCVLKGIRAGKPPTLRELAARMGFSFARAQQHVAALQWKGWIRVDYSIARGLRLTTAAKRTLAGMPLLNWEDLNRR